MQNFSGKVRKLRHRLVRDKCANCKNSVSGLSAQFLDYPDCFWIVLTVSGLSGQFLDCPDSFLVIRTVSSMLRERFELKGAISTLLQFFFLDICKNFPDSNAATLTRFL